MKVARPGFKKGAVPADVLAPDFAVLLAGLSAHQSASATARRQILIENGRFADTNDTPPPVDIIVHGRRPVGAAPTGSFSADVARALSRDSGMSRDSGK